MNDKRKVELVPYTPMWKEYYLKECRTLEKLLRKNFIEVYHIGSTAIPTIVSKPTLDILCVVHTLDGIEAFKYEFEQMGLLYQGENGVPGRLYFIRLAKDGVKHMSHIHIFEKGNPLINDHLDFRDYLNAEKDIAKEYENLKLQLIKEHGNNPDLYTSAKSEFIQSVLTKLR